MTEEQFHQTVPEEMEQSLPEAVDIPKEKPCNCRRKRRLGMLAVALVLILAVSLAVQSFLPRGPRDYVLYFSGNALCLSDGTGSDPIVLTEQCVAPSLSGESNGWVEMGICMLSLSYTHADKNLTAVFYPDQISVSLEGEDFSYEGEDFSYRLCRMDLTKAAKEPQVIDTGVQGHYITADGEMVFYAKGDDLYVYRNGAPERIVENCAGLANSTHDGYISATLVYSAEDGSTFLWTEKTGSVPMDIPGIATELTGNVLNVETQDRGACLYLLDVKTASLQLLVENIDDYHISDEKNIYYTREVGEKRFSFCHFDGSRETVLCEELDKGFYHLQFAQDSPAVLFEAATGEDSYETKLALGSTVYPLAGKFAVISKDGSLVYYLDNLTGTAYDETGDLFRVTVTKGGPGESELVGAQVSTWLEPKFSARGEIIYTRNVDRLIGDLYMDGQLIAEQVYANITPSMPRPQSGWYYMAPTEGGYDLYLKQPNGETVFVAGGLKLASVHFLGNNPVYITMDGDTGCSTLTVYDAEEGTYRILSEDTFPLISVLSNR